MERLTPDDTAFLHLENQISAMHSVSVAILDGPEPTMEAIRDRLADRIAYVPRFRQRVVEVPMGLERPVWINNPRFNLDYHVRHTALPEPTGDALANLVSRILSQRLDRGKSLWELWVISGLADGRWAILTKAHHAIIDGVSGIDPLAVVVDEFITSTTTPPRWEPDEMPSERDLIDGAVRDLLTKPSEQLRVLRRLSRLPGEAVTNAKRLTVDGGEQRGPHRRWASAPVPFEAVRARRLAANATTNDVLLTCVVMGLRTLAEFGPPWDGPSVRVVIPYAVGPGGVFTNEVASLDAVLPLHLGSFDEVLAEVDRRLAPRSRKRRRVPAAAMSNRRGLAAPTLAALGVRRVSREATGPADTVVVNAPGPREQVSILERPVVSLASALPLAAGVPISFGIVSYVDHFTLSATTDLDSGIDPAEVTAAMAEACIG